MVVIRGPATLNLGQIRRDFESFVVALVYADKQTYREQTREVRGAIGGALAMMCEPAGIQKLLDSVYFFDESDRPYYVYNLWGGGRVSAVAGWSPGQPEEFRALCLAAVATPEVRRSSQLMTMTLADGVERFQRFFLLWTGLEILTNKIFVRIVSLDGTKPIQVPDDVRGRVDAQKAKLQDKFTLLAAHVFPGEAAVDCKEFERLRKARDLLIHSGEGADRDLPVEEASRMLTKYLRGTAEVLGPVS